MTKTLVGPQWPEPVRILSEITSEYGFITVEAVGLTSGRHYSTVLWPGQMPAAATAWRPDFSADADVWRLLIEAERLKLAYACDPLVATNNCLVDLLPHQLEAVYDVMLPQPTIRHLLAHDAGAGKTIMCGLLHKELRLRQPDLRTLIVAPAGLVTQWKREMAQKFGERFEEVDGQVLKGDNAIWLRNSSVVTSVAFARQPHIRATLAAIRWDLVIVDEAHHMAGYEDRATQAYQLGQTLAAQTRHLVLATATPHKGNPVNFTKLLQLLDPDIHDAQVVLSEGQRENPLLWRRLKEEMVGFDGQKLFKPRIVESRWSSITERPLEAGLYNQLTDYVSRTYKAAEKLSAQERVNVEFAMTILQRRMASSLAALIISLKRRRELVLAGMIAGSPLAAVDEDAPEAERWEVEKAALGVTPAKTKEARAKEANRLAELISLASEVQAEGTELKLRKLKQIMEETGIRPDGKEKLLVFTEFKDTLDFLRAEFVQQGFRVTQIDGSMPQDARLRAEWEFEHRAQVMVATEAAGEGINLQFCAIMVNYDLPWTPTRLEQRMGRIHRYGQKRVAHIYNLAIADTREGVVLTGLLDRLKAMEKDLGDQVFDVVSTLVADVDLNHLLAQAALAAPDAASGQQALSQLIKATAKGATRVKSWRRPPTPLDPARYEPLRERSRQARLTPEYAQHFAVDVLSQRSERPQAMDGKGVDAGDAAVIRLEMQGQNLARQLGLRAGEPVLLSFRPETSADKSGAHLVGIGSQFLDGLLRFVAAEWGGQLPQGAVFRDSELPPGQAYLLWFILASIQDGCGDPVTRSVFAIRQTAETLAVAPAYALGALIPAASGFALPASLLALSADPKPISNWSLAHQQAAWLRQVRAGRQETVRMRRAPMLADAQRALAAAQEAYDAATFGGGGDPEQETKANAQLTAAQSRLQTLADRFWHEETCTLAWPTVLGVAAVLPLTEAPDQEMVDRRRQVEDAAMAYVMGYETSHGRTVTNVTGEHKQYPYDFYSAGPGGPRCIEVKGTTTGDILLSRNERVAAQHLGGGYYLYIVSDPLGQPALNIVRNPAARMQPDAELHGDVTYAYYQSSWRAASDEEITL